jgi:hypothetical protein
MAGVSIAVYFLAGVATYFPNTKPYAMFIKPIVFVAFCIGIFMYGGSGVDAINKAEIQRLEQKAAMAAQASKDENLLLLSKLKNNQAQITAQQNISAKSILNKKKKLDNECKINIDTVQLYNSAILNNKLVENNK